MKKRQDAVSFEQETTDHTLQKIPGHWSRHIFMLVAIILFLVAGFWMIEDHFPRVSIDRHVLAVYLLLVPAFYALYEIGIPYLEMKWNKGKRLFQIFVSLVTIAVLWAVLQGSTGNGFTAVGDCFREYLSEYMGQFNSYFLTNFHIRTNAGFMQEDAPKVLCFFLIYAGFLFTYLTKKRVLWMSFPTLVFASYLLVGITPTYTGIALFLLGIVSLRITVMSDSSDQKKGLKGTRLGKRSRFGFLFPNMAALVILGIVLVMIPQYMNERAQELAQNSAKMKNNQEKLEKVLKDTVTNIPTVSLSSDKEIINNRKPVFTNQTMMTLYASEKPKGHIYLRSYLGTNYDRGIWSYSEGTLYRDAKKKGIDEKDLQRKLQSGIYEQVVRNGNGATTVLGADSDIASMRYLMEYETSIGDKALMPYFTEWDENVKYVKDVLPKRNLTQHSFVLWGLNMNQWTLQDLQKVQKAGTSYDLEKFWNFYDEYVMENYLSGSKDVASAAEIAKQFDLEEEDGSLWGINRRRLLVASRIHEYLNQYTYSQDLDRIKDGTDSVEYMLTQSKKGFCVHFATAGTLMLRSLGIPARYVGGYVTDSSEFELAPDGRYVSVIPDSYAHSWTEVYLDHIGWIPIEMTAGYGSTILDISRNDLEMEYDPEYDPYEEEEHISNPIPSNTPAVTPQTQAEPTPTADPQGAVSPTPYVKMTPSPNPPGQTPDVKHVEDGDMVIIEDEEPKSPVSTVLKTIFRVFLLVVIVIAIFVGIRFLMNHKKESTRLLLSALMRKGFYGRVVKRIHMETYKSLRKHGKVLWNLTADAAVLAALQEVYKDISAKEWEDYMEIVKEAYFSNHELQKEQAQFCLTLFNKIK